MDEEADEEDSKSKSVSQMTTACHCDDSLKARDSYSHVIAIETILVETDIAWCCSREGNVVLRHTCDTLL